MRMRALKICLWVAGILCLLSVFGMFLPISAWQSFAKIFGIESLPDSPVFVYAARLMSATYVAVGVFFVILALAPMKYGIMVPFAGIASVLLGVVCAIAGLIAAMPTLWFLGDSLSCVVLGVLILVFWRQAQRRSEALIDAI
jgi:hypothetical protein